MTFRKPGVNTAESVEGFIVRRKSRFELEYYENGKGIIVEVEPGEGLAIYASSMRNDDKQRIIKNIGTALDFLGIKYILEP
jgi:hypothetical protein